MLRLIECAHVGAVKWIVTYQSSRQHYCMSPPDEERKVLVGVQTASSVGLKSAIGQLVDVEPQVRS